MRIWATFWISLKHVWYNRRLEAGLLLGLVVAVAIASAIPIYTAASLQRGLMRQWIESSTSRPPFALMVSYWGVGQPPDNPQAAYDKLHTMMADDIVPRLQLPYSTYARAAALGVNRFVPTDSSRRPAPSPFADVWTLSNVEQLADIVEGRWPEPGAYDDPTHLEVVVDEAALEYLQLLVGTDYHYTIGTGAQQKQLTLHVVGVFRPRPDLLDTTHWVLAPPFQNVFFIHEDDFYGRALGDLQLTAASLDWYWVFDHTAVSINDLDRLITTLTSIETRAGQMLPGTRLWTSPLPTFQLYRARATTVELFMIALSLPMFAMVLYYVSLIAGLAIDNRTQEIAMLRSRGATAYQVMLGFAVEWGILGLLALVIGTPLGLVIARAMGASAGFLSFVDRVGLPVTLSMQAYRMGALAAVTAVAAALLPVVPALRYSIVTLKSAQGTADTRPAFWHRYFLDVAVLGVAYLGYRQLQQGAGAMTAGEAVPFDPGLFLVPFLLTLGFGLLALRLFPLLMRLLELATRRWSGVSWALTTRQLARGSRQYGPLLLLLIVTTSLGIYAAAAARTLDQNLTDQISYRHGADAVLQEQWKRTVYVADNPDSEPVPVEEVYEPPFYVHTHLPGVDGAARVLRRTVDVRLGGTFRGQGHVLGIVPTEFADVSWFRDRLLPVHRNHYLNALLQHEAGVLADESYMRAHRLELGDWITFDIGGQPVEAYIVAPIAYWPTLDPRNGPMFVLNLEHIQEHTAMEPYDVWLRLAPGAQLQPIVNELADEGIYVTHITDTRRSETEARRDPLRMAFFGVLTIGFIVAGVVTVIGFFLFHFLSIRRRLLQFGVLRAMGLSPVQLTMALLFEGVLTVGMGLGIGSVLGTVSARVFLPMLQLTEELADAVPPFTVIIDQADISRIHVLLLSMLVMSVAALAVALFKMRLHQAVKLGEEG